VKQAERRLAQSSAMIGVATAELYPSITLGASAGFTGFVEDLGKRSTQRFGFGPLISWTIPDSGSRARVTAAKADNAARWRILMAWCSMPCAKWKPASACMARICSG
jgi:outer membrane protein TolC